jgi:hypothetical protein
MRKHKPYQLAMAQKVGVKIPLTLMTNDVEQARAFWRRHEGEVIYKQFIAFPDAWRETRRLRPENETQPEVVPAPADTPGWRFSGTFPPRCRYQAVPL